MVAYSGGIDSALLAFLAHRVLKDKMLAVIADSPSLARREYRHAVEFAQLHGIPLKIIRTKELDKEGYLANAGDRCYYCKQSLFEKLGHLKTHLTQESHQIWTIAYGVNTNDLGDYRPGLKAAKEAEVFSPYLDLKISKEQIRQMAKDCHLSIFDKPAMPCLSSRIPHGQRVDTQKLSQIEQAEDVLFDLNFRIFRVRHHQDLARIEIAENEFQNLLSQRHLIEEAFRKIGFHFVAMDLSGFQSGSLNRGLKLAD